MSLTAQESVRSVAEPEPARGVTGGVVRDAVREAGADVCHAQHVGEELGELVDPGREFCDLCAQGVRPVVAGEDRVLVTDHAGAGGGRGDHRVVPLEGPGEAGDQGDGLRPVAGVKCICPQQVCSGGKSTLWPRRSRTVTTALPVPGKRVSLKQVRKSATRISRPPWASARRRGAARVP